jgi:hypothetical protein
VLAVVALGAMAVPKTKTGRKGRIDQAVKGVAAFLGKTARVPRLLYRSTRLRSLPRWSKGIAAALRRAGSLDEVYLPSAQPRIERAVMRLLSG